MISFLAWLSAVRVPVEEKWGYIWGTSGQVWTKEKQAGADREMTRLYGSRWIGRRVCDCSGLIFWAAASLGEAAHHGSNLIYTEDCVPETRAALTGGLRQDGTLPRPGSAVFLCREEGGKVSCHHVGVYLGGGMTAEAKGTRDGVVVSSLSRWHRSAELKFVDYGEDEEGGGTVETAKETILDAQRALVVLGFDPGKIDGVYGPRTANALKAFMEKNGLQTEAEAFAALKEACVPIPLTLARTLYEALKKGVGA